MFKILLNLKERKQKRKEKKKKKRSWGNADMKSGVEGVAPLIQTCRSCCHMGMETSLNFNSWFDQGSVKPDPKGILMEKLDLYFTYEQWLKPNVHSIQIV